MSVFKPEQYATSYALLVSALTLILDYVTGPYISFPILFTLPVLIVAWYRGRRLGLCFAVVLSVARLGLAWYEHALWMLPESLVNALVRIVVLGLIASLAATVRTLQEHVRVLHGILPICSFCKKIRDREGQWQMLEAYIAQHSEAMFSHGLCPQCAKEQYGDFLDAAGGSQ